MINKASRSEIREKKHRRLRHHLNGTATTPRLAVFRSNKHIYAQIIDDTVGTELQLLLVWQYFVPTSTSMHRLLMTQLVKL